MCGGCCGDSVARRRGRRDTKAFIVLKEIATEQELMEYVSNRVARYKRVRVIEFIEQIPKSASGKILRRTLVARERAKLV